MRNRASWQMTHGQSPRECEISRSRHGCDPPQHGESLPDYHTLLPAHWCFSRPWFFCIVREHITCSRPPNFIVLSFRLELIDPSSRKITCPEPYFLLLRAVLLLVAVFSTDGSSGGGSGESNPLLIQPQRASRKPSWPLRRPVDSPGSLPHLSLKELPYEVRICTRLSRHLCFAADDDWLRRRLKWSPKQHGGDLKQH